jgi:hypothetical protein
MRRTEKEPFGEPWTGCGETCPDLRKPGCCKPSGDLYFVMADFPNLGSVCRLHTTSYKSIRQIYSALEQIRTITGGRLAGIQCRLTVRPDRAAYTENGQKKTTTVYALNIELSANGMKKLISEMTQHAELFQQTRGLLTDGRKVVYVADEENETAKAEEVTEEFNPEQQWGVKNSAEIPADKYDGILKRFQSGSMDDPEPYKPTADEVVGDAECRTRIKWNAHVAP